MPTNLFSTYSTGENRVTASFLAVLRSLSLDRIQRVLGALLEQSEFELVKFQNQPSKGAAGVPDAIIQSSCTLLIETKIKRNTANRKQLERHLKRLDGATESTCLLLVLTPDTSKPRVFDSIEDERLVWASFAALDQVIDEMLDDKAEVVSEREAFLLRELQNMLMTEKLIGSANDVVVVPARNAWPEYEKFHAYICQPDRPFQLVSRIAFYSFGHIYHLVPKILETHEHVDFVPSKHKGKMRELIAAVLTEERRKEGTAYKVMFLSAPDSSDTLVLEAPIPNNLTSNAGRTTAFTQNQRYVSLERLKVAKTTSDLVEGLAGNAKEEIMLRKSHFEWMSFEEVNSESSAVSDERQPCRQYESAVVSHLFPPPSNPRSSIFLCGLVGETEQREPAFRAARLSPLISKAIF